ncbi:MAG: SCP2 sterol-binding domain-containing protein [Thermodesulfobacteriota bacterium]
MKLEEHPTVKWFRSTGRTKEALLEPQKLDADWLRELCLKAGADDVGFVEIDRPSLGMDKQELLEAMPGTRTVVSLAFRLNREPIRTVAHSMANLEFGYAIKHANDVARRIVNELQARSIRVLNAPVGFPYEMDRWPGKLWWVRDKIVAEEAGLGRTGWNRLILHPRFGPFMVLGTMLLNAEMTAYSKPLDNNPCIECKLCISVCPVGTIKADGYFDFPSCYTHNYRERLGGFIDWVENIAGSKSVVDYRRRVSEKETVSMWQNLSIGAQTRCDRCMAVCPAGEEGIGEFLTDRAGYTQRLLKGPRDRQETIYVVRGSDAEEHVTSHFPHKTVKQVSNGIRPRSVQAFLRGMPITFQRGRSEGLNASFHFTFTGEEPCKATVIIRDQTIEVHDDHVGAADVHLTADSGTWLGFLAKEKNLLWAIITGKIRVKGPLKLMPAFAKCFPS